MQRLHPTGKTSDTIANRQFRAGFVAMLALWTGAIPFGIAYAAAASEAGLGLVEIQMMSLTVFSAAAQVSAVALISAGATTVEILAAAMALNVQLLLLGAVISREIPLTWPRRLLTAALLTDGAFAVALSRGRLVLPSLLGAGLSMYIGWNLGTALGIALGQSLPDPRRLAIDFVVPLTFLAVLVPLLRTRPAVLVAAIAAVTAALLSRVVPGGVALITSGVIASLAGVWLTRTPAGEGTP